MAMALTTSNLIDELYDETPGYENESNLILAPGLSAVDMKQATILYRLFNELWGLCIIRGDPGTGKDTFLNWLLYTIKRYFPNKRIIRDEKPRKLFGAYDSLFNEATIQENLKRMREIAKGERAGVDKSIGQMVYNDALEKAADEWVGSDGAKVLLQNAVIGLTEFWKYVYNREPHNPMNKTMGGIHKMKRHLNSLIVGCTQLESDLDKKTCKPFVDWRVTCTRSAKDTSRYMFIVEKVKYDKRQDVLVPIGKPFIIPVDAGKPRSYIGDGKIIIKKHHYIPQTEEERIVLEVLKAGVTNYDDLVSYIESEGDMSEYEILYTLKELCLKLPGKNLKAVIWYPCVYFLFNSRSAPSLKSGIKVEE